MTVLALFVLLTLPGYALARALFGLEQTRERPSLSYGIRLFLPIAISVLVSTWLGLVLAELSFFSLPLLIALVLLMSAAVLLARRGRLAVWPLWPPPRNRYTVLFSLAFLIAILLAARPAEYILGNYDAGVYVNIGVNLARTGSITIWDPLVSRLPADSSRQFFWDLINPFMLYKQVRLPGFFVADAAAGRVMPQFLHLYPVWLAIWDAALGLQLGLYATPFVGLMGSLAAYFLARELFGRRVALLAFFLLVLDVPQFWFARYPVSEGFSQFLLLTGLFGMARFMRRDAKPTRDVTSNDVLGRGSGGTLAFALLAGASLGALLLTRGDMILLWAPLGLYFLYVVFWRKWRLEHWAFFGVFALLQVQAIAHMIVFSPDYIYFQYTHVLRARNINLLLGGYDSIPTVDEFLSTPVYRIGLIGVMIGGAALLWAADRLFQAVRRWTAATRMYRKWVEAQRGEQVGSLLRWGAAGAIVALFLYAYFVAPHVQSVLAYIGDVTTLDRGGNLVKLGWYLSPIGLALAVFGAVIALRRDLHQATLFFLGATFLFAYVYIEELYANPHYIYTMRRYAPLVIPALILLAARALVWLWDAGTHVVAQDGASLVPKREPPSLTPAPLRFAAGTCGPRSGGVRRLAARGAPILAAALLVAWLGYNAYAMGLVDYSRAQGLALRVPFIKNTQTLGFVRLEPIEKAIVAFSELEGAVEQVAALAEEIPPDAIAIMVNNRDEPATIATPLKYAFGRDVLVARFNQPNGDKIAALVDGWRAAGRPVYLLYGVNGGKLALPGYDLMPVGHFSLDVPQWAFAYQYMPRGAWRVNLNYVIYRAQPRTGPVVYPLDVDFGGDDAPFTAGGFLERAPEERTRWSGQILDPGSGETAPRTVEALLRLPLSATGARFVVSLEARGLQDGETMVVSSGDKQVGRAALSAQFQTYRWGVDSATLATDGETFWLTIQTDLARDASGRMVGAEFRRLQLQVEGARNLEPLSKPQFAV